MPMPNSFTPPIHLYLVDDSMIHLEGLKLLLSDNSLYEIVGEATQSAEVLKDQALKKADVVLLDISLQTENDGLGLIQPIMNKYPGIKIIMLSHNKDVSSIVTSIQMGAKAYIAKDTSLSELDTAIRVVMQGHALFLGETIPKTTLINCFSTNPTPHNAKAWNLTQREIEIIGWLAKGFIAKEIAEILHINVTTVESHKENIKQKLNVKTVVEMVVFALQHNIIKPC